MSAYKHSKSFSDFSQFLRHEKLCKICNSEVNTFGFRNLGQKDCGACLDSACHACFRAIRISDNSKQYSRLCGECCRSHIRAITIRTIEQRIKNLRRDTDLLASSIEKGLNKLEKKINHCRTAKEKIEAIKLTKFEANSEHEKIILKLRAEEKEIKGTILDTKANLTDLNSTIDANIKELTRVQKELEELKETGEYNKKALGKAKNILAELQDENIRQVRQLENFFSTNNINFSIGKIRNKHDKLRALIREESNIIEDISKENQELEQKIQRFEALDSDSAQTSEPMHQDIDLKKLEQQLNDQKAEILTMKLKAETTNEVKDITKHTCKACILQ